MKKFKIIFLIAMMFSINYNYVYAIDNKVKTSQTDKVTSACLLYTSDAADEEDSGDLCGSRITKKKQIWSSIGDALPKSI